jgi:hypothetical protein
MKLKTLNEIKQSYLINNEWWEHLLHAIYKYAEKFSIKGKFPS